MKMVKSLLLGSAAGVVAMAGAQAADLPVKAKPVQYVKICSLYGAGFYYIPGTDMCLKMGGWVRLETAWGTNGNLTFGADNGNVNNRGTSNMAWRSRGYITADARNQSEYGTIRSYIAVGINTSSVGLDTAANQFSANRAFIQFAGFTFGLSQSFYDFYSIPATAFWGAYPASDTGDGGFQTMAYTAQFGGGMSASLSLEQRRITQIINQNTANTAGTGTIAGGTFPTTSAGATANAGAYGGWNVPDFVGNLRIEQPWGSAQIMGALHEVNGAYYASTGAIEDSGHPGDVWGFALGAGVKILAPAIGAGDYLQAQFNYTQGASRYIFNVVDFNYYYQQGESAAYGVLSDAVYGGSVTGGTASGLDLTTAWNVNAAYEHYWNKKWKTSLYGGYVEVSYNAEANAMLCVNQASGNGLLGTAARATAGCDNDWQLWWIGSRTQWNVSPDTYLGVDVLYQNLNSATTASGVVGANTIPAATGTRTNVRVSDKDSWMFRFRVHKDFYP